LSDLRDEAAWRQLVRSAMAPCWRLLAEGSGGSVWEHGDVLAAIVPAARERSVFNSVFYERGELLVGSLDRIAAAYDQAGINAWAVWVPEEDIETAAALERAGHVLDSEPRYMGMELVALREPEGEDELRIREREDYAELARINEIAYGYRPGEYRAVAEAPMPGIRIYFAELDGKAVSTLGIWPHRSDAMVIWVATLPEARGRGIASRLLAHALRRARAEGLETTSLKASKLGRSIYQRLGYRDFGAAHMWERRKAE
jgi:GNAT superfamily N-acetyltransferase